MDSLFWVSLFVVVGLLLAGVLFFLGCWVFFQYKAKKINIRLNQIQSKLKSFFEKDEEYHNYKHKFYFYDSYGDVLDLASGEKPVLLIDCMIGSFPRLYINLQSEEGLFKVHFSKGYKRGFVYESKVIKKSYKEENLDDLIVYFMALCMRD